MHLDVLVKYLFWKFDLSELKMQLHPGPLSAVGDLKVDAENTSSVTISWSAPFSLDVTAVDSDIWYSVLIYNVPDENNPTAVFSVNVTNKSYQRVGRLSI